MTEVAKPDPFANVALPANVNDLVAQYVKLRDSIKLADDAHKEKMAPARAYLERLNGALLQQLQAIGGDSVATPAGTAYKTTKRSATVADSAEFRAYIIENRAWDLADWRANGPAVDEHLKEHSVLPPGVIYRLDVTVGVRRK